MMPYFDNPPLIQSSKFNNSFGHVYSYAKIFLILYPPLENSTTRIAITWKPGASVDASRGQGAALDWRGVVSIIRWSSSLSLVS